MRFFFLSFFEDAEEESESESESEGGGAFFLETNFTEAVLVKVYESELSESEELMGWEMKSRLVLRLIEFVLLIT